MPRLAPVRSSARRGWLSCGVGMGHSSSWIEPRLAPRCARRSAAKLDAVVQPIGAILPELDDQGYQPVSNPVRRTWNRSNRELRHRSGERLLESHAAFERG